MADGFSASSENSEKEAIKRDRALIDQAFEIRQAGSGSFLHRDHKSIELQKISRQNTEHYLMNQLKPHFGKLLQAFCARMDQDWPFLPTVFFQLQTRKGGSALAAAKSRF